MPPCILLTFDRSPDAFVLSDCPPRTTSSDDCKGFGSLAGGADDDDDDDDDTDVNEDDDDDDCCRARPVGEISGVSIMFRNSARGKKLGAEGDIEFEGCASPGR